MNEPTVLDYIKTLFNKKERERLDPLIKSSEPIENVTISSSQTAIKKARTCKKRLLSGILIALIGQILLEPPSMGIVLPVICYLVAISLLWLSLKGYSTDLRLQPSKEKPAENGLLFNRRLAIASVLLLILAFLSFGKNQFTFLNVSLWTSGIIFFLASFWQKGEQKTIPSPTNESFYGIVLLVFAIATFYRFYLLNQVPGEMFSDHAEKLLDVMDVLNGKFPFFFIRNTGREAFQFYLTAVIITLFKTGINFISLKLGTAFLGFITLPFVFLLARQLFNRWVAAAAVFFSGIAYWLNVISRVGLRFPLYPLFTAISLYFLFKGLEEKKYNPLLLSGLFIGLGLHGYSPFRIVPVLVVVIFAVFLIKEKSVTGRSFTMKGLPLLTSSALIVFLPLARFIFDHPGEFNYRALSRLTSVENPIDGSSSLIFLENLWKSLTMFFYRNGVVWVNSVPNRPALDIISAVFLVFGFLVIIKRLIKNQSWQDFSLLLSIPILMLPSILSLAFPGENPALNRSGGAAIIIFCISGLGLVSFIQMLFSGLKKTIGKLTAGLFIGSLLAITLMQNFDLVFNQYADQFLDNAWNTSEIGNVILKFSRNGNSPNNAFVVPYPHWVDTRLVGINAGYPKKDYALWPEDFSYTSDLKGNLMFIIKPEDRNTLHTLKLLYPKAEEEFFYSKIPGKNFLIISTGP